MNKEYIEAMVTDRNGNIYISLEQYKKDIDRIKESIITIRKNLLHTKKSMEKLYKKSGSDIESFKALGYIEAINYLTKYLKKLLESHYDIEEEQE